MQTKTDIEIAVERSKCEILEDIAAGRVSADVASFSELHDYVDANEYGGLCDDDAYGDFDLDFAVAVQDAVDAWLKTGRRQTTFDGPLDVGARVAYTTVASWGRATGSGIYLGCALDEEDGVPYHYFADGEINGHPQTSHGFPAEAGTPTTTDLTPTALITEAEAQRVSA
jgi:hypothetical protein